MSRNRSFFVAALFIGAGLASTAGADVITVKNTLGWDMTLSDLIVWSKDGTQEVLKKPGNDEAGSADDEVLKKDQSATFVSAKDIAKTFVSFKGKNVGECEWKWGAEVGTVGFAAGFSNVETQDALHAAVIGPEGANLILAPGQMFNIVNGLCDQLPGLFVGTVADFSNGEISGAFTGIASVASGSVQYEVTPAPGTLALVGFGAIAVARRRR